MVLVDVLAGHSLRGSLVLWGQWHLQPQWGKASMLGSDVSTWEAGRVGALDCGETPGRMGW